MSSKRFQFLLPCIALLILSAPLIADDEATIPNLDQKRNDVVRWLEEHVGDELLISPEALLSLIKQVQTLPNDEFEKWYIETRRVRTALQSEEWQETRAWLSQYLDTQGVYSAGEVKEFKSDVAHLTPSQLLQLMQKIRQKQQSQAAARQASNRNRNLAMSMRNELVSAQQSASVAAGSRGSGNVQSYFGPSSSGPVQSSYAQRKNSYRRNLGIWPGGHSWGRW